MAGAASVHIPFSATDGISPKISRINKSMSGLAKNTSKSSIAIGSAIGTFIGGVAIQAFNGLTSAIGSAVTDAVEFQKLGDQLAQTIKTTGNAAQVSVKGIEDLAAGLESMSGIDEKLIINSANVLASFKGIANEGGKAGGTFDRTIESALNLSTTMGGDVVGATELLGKALVNPIKGLAKLTRAGVSFTAAEEEQIQALTLAGKLTEAQGIILAKVEGRYDGAAEAAGKGFAGSVARAQDAIGDLLRKAITPLLDPLAKLADRVATDVVPAIERMAEKFNKDIRPGLEQVIRQIASGLAPVLATMGDIIRNAVLPAIGSFFGFLSENKEVVLAIVAGIIAMVAAFKTYQMVMTAVQTVMKAYAIIQGIVNIVMSANPVGLIVLGIIGLIAAFAALYASSEGFRNAISGLFGVLSAVGSFIVDVFVGAFNLLGQVIGAIGKAIMDSPFGTFLKLAIEVAKGIGSIVGAVGDVVGGVVGGIADGIGGFVGGIGDAIGGAVSTVGSVAGAVGSITGITTGGAPTSGGTMFPGMATMGAPRTTVNVQIGNEQLVPTVTKVMGSTASATTGRRGY